MAEVRVIKVEDNPDMDVPGHTRCTGKEIAGDMIGIESYALKKGYFGKGGISEEHTHEESEHVFYILSGELTIYANDNEYVAKAGEALHIPPRIPHASANTFDGPTTYIALTLPPT